MGIVKIRYDLLEEHGLHTSIAAIGVLEKLGVLEKWHNSENGRDKTWQYKIDTDVLKQLLEERKLRGKR